MKRYVEIQLSRYWQLTVVKPDVWQEYLVPEHQLGAMVAGIACEPDVVDFRCVPFHPTAFPDVWMVSRPLPAGSPVPKENNSVAEGPGLD